jgi:hypothetical protein
LVQWEFVALEHPVEELGLLEESLGGFGGYLLEAR